MHDDEQRQEQQQREQLIRHEGLIRDEQTSAEYCRDDQQQRLQAARTTYECACGVVHDEPTGEIDEYRNGVPLRLEERLQRKLQLSEIELRHEWCETKDEPCRNDERGTGVAAWIFLPRRQMHELSDAAPSEPADRAERCTQRIEGAILETRNARGDVQLGTGDPERKQRPQRGRYEQWHASAQARVEPQIKAETERQVQKHVRDPIAAS